MLYPTTTITEPSQNNIYTVEPGCLVAFPMDIASGQSFRLKIVHLAVGVQDHSLRAWIAHEPGGSSVSRGETHCWHPNRTPYETVVVYDESLDPPAETSIPVAPGSYCLNILNLVNARNTFSFVLTEVA